MQQKMADLPAERLLRTPPFFHCGIDVFGPFHTRRGKSTRNNPGTDKLWVLLFSCLYSRAVHLEILDNMDTASFKMAFSRFQAIRGECTYLRSDKGSNFMGARNERPEITDETIQQAKSLWEQQGKKWDINPPLASHFGGVWERAIGQIRQVIEGYLLPQEQRLLSREEFHTMLLHTASIVNSTPLWEPAESPNDPEPICPQHLLTQRDDNCNSHNNRPAVYNANDLQAYGANRWKRVEALAEEFWQYWQHYLYQIGTKKEKWFKPERNAQVGDLVLMKDKNSPRLNWSTGTITQAMTVWSTG